MSDKDSITPWAGITKSRMTILEQIETLEMRLNTERRERISADDYARKAARAPRSKARTTAMPKLSEAAVTRQICDFLRARHWRMTRNQVGRLRSPDGKRWITVGEVGHADWTAVRPRGQRRGDCQLIYVEMKAPGKRPSAAQETWLWCRRQESYLAGWWDSLESFAAWYAYWIDGGG